MPKGNKGVPRPESAFNMAVAVAAKNLLKDSKAILDEKNGDPEKDALFRIYQRMDMIGYRNGNPVLQAGLPPFMFRDQVLRIQNLTDGHVTTTTMANLVSVAVQSTLEVLGEIRVERAESKRASGAGEETEEATEEKPEE